MKSFRAPILLLAVLACSSPAEPLGEPHVAGTVFFTRYRTTWSELWVHELERPPVSAAAGDTIVVVISPDTRIFVVEDHETRHGTWDDLVPGIWVRAWTTGTYAKTLPIQVMATRVEAIPPAGPAA